MPILCLMKFPTIHDTLMQIVLLDASLSIIWSSCLLFAPRLKLHYAWNSTMKWIEMNTFLCSCLWIKKRERMEILSAHVPCYYNEMKLVICYAFVANWKKWCICHTMEYVCKEFCVPYMCYDYEKNDVYALQWDMLPKKKNDVYDVDAILVIYCEWTGDVNIY